MRVRVCVCAGVCVRACVCMCAHVGAGQNYFVFGLPPQLRETCVFVRAHSGANMVKTLGRQRHEIFREGQHKPCMTSLLGEPATCKLAGNPPKCFPMPQTGFGAGLVLGLAWFVFSRKESVEHVSAPCAVNQHETLPHVAFRCPKQVLPVPRTGFEQWPGLYSQGKTPLNIFRSLARQYFIVQCQTGFGGALVCMLWTNPEPCPNVVCPWPNSFWEAPQQWHT